jgi:adenine-specific DNA-methyltransferase
MGVEQPRKHMASELDVLLDKVEDPALRADLRRQVGLLRAKRRFGLVFEEHLPERVQLPEHTVRRGTRVVLRDDDDQEPREVLKVAKGKATVRSADGDTEAIPVADLLVVADFGEPIYPGLRRLGSLNAGGNKPAHVVIKGENHHVLEALQFTHAGKVDCVYIDPPYNTGARDWKYGNDYVDADDRYRHSKWLAFMERRLRLARDLLNRDDSVLIVAIDEKEYLRLGLLLAQVFPDADIQMVTVVTNRAGSTRAGRFSRVDEYLFFVYFGTAVISRGTSSMLSDPSTATSMPTVWFTAVRRGGGSALRDARPGLFYPVLLDAESGALHSVGDPLPKGSPRESYEVPSGTVAMWPLSNEGREQTWRFSAERMREYFAAGTARLGKRDPATGHRPITYLQPGTLTNIEAGVFKVVGRTDEGALQIELVEDAAKTVAPGTVWNITSHYARDHGSKLNENFIPQRRFPYPKSLYAVEDALRFAVGDKPEAVVLDFFAGSGTTAHAVARLNRQDRGRRQSITVTNNEVSAEEAAALRRRGLRPGDPEWETLGIFDHITRPRITAAVAGVTPEGEPVKGDYRFTDEFPMSEGLEENVEFFELTYLDSEDVEISAAFEGIAPLLWLRAGGRGEMIEHDAPYYAVMETYGVLFNPDRWRKFVSELHEDVRTVFVVTDSPSIFAAIASELPAGVEAVRLYENYLSTFTLNTRTVPVAELAE